ncbi:MAG: hypothetical protein ABIK62_08070, partial [candidate division WOR-3 bacterium]
ELGTFTIRCSTALADDENPANDAMNQQVEILLNPTGSWEKLADLLPAPPRSKLVKGGGCMTQLSDGSTSHVYAFVGNGTYAFERYDPGTQSWVLVESIPAYNREDKKKPVKDGAALAAAGGKVYATKGNNTLEFWMYDPGASGGYPWTQLADVPPGSKKVKAGAGMAAANFGGAPCVFLLKGNGTSEFYRYNTNTAVWEAAASAPAGPSGKPYKAGSCITANIDDGQIYLLKGSYNEFFRYQVASDIWETLKPLPLKGTSGKSRKAKAGASIAFARNSEGDVKYVFCLKGGNCNEFWQYDVARDTWTQLPDMPSGAKFVKDGGALTADRAADLPSVFALRGNSTTEFFYFYTVPVGVEESPAVPARLPARVSVVPNPSHSEFCIRLSSELTATDQVEIYSATGCLVRVVPRLPGVMTLVWDGRDSEGTAVPGGVYLVRAGSVSVKAVVER